MEFKGTKGEWTSKLLTVTKSNGEKIRQICPPEGACIISMKINQDRRKADAKLIAAAPELLKALDKMSQCFQYRLESGEKLTPKEKQIWEQAEKAINKALK